MYKSLTHLSSKGYYQFVTFRTHDSLDDFLVKISNSQSDNHKKQYQIDQYLDSSSKGAYLNEEVLALLKSYIIKQDKKLFELISFVIMPNHVHILFKETIKLSEAMKKLKGGSAFLINKHLGKKGKFWVADYYDKLIRDEKHLETVYHYIKNNPIKVGLKDYENRFYSCYE